MNSSSHSENQPDTIRSTFFSADPDPLGHGRRLSSPSFPRDQEAVFTVRRVGEHPVGLGGYSDVWKAVMIEGNGVKSLVALKVLRPTNSDQARLHRSLEREVRCWQPLNHKNIALFYGVVNQSNGSPAFVLPWYENGSADVYLQRNPRADPMLIIWDIVAGIEYLHGKGIVHGDLKGANVMVDDDGHARLIDFGLSRILDSEDGLTTGTMSSVRWCAPELLCPRSDDVRATKSSDVYAFASTILELLTGKVPYHTMVERFIPLTVMKGVTPRSVSSRVCYDIPHSPGFWGMLEKCWDEATLRPSIYEVRLCLQGLYFRNGALVAPCSPRYLDV